MVRAGWVFLFVCLFVCLFVVAFFVLFFVGFFFFFWGGGGSVFTRLGHEHQDLLSPCDEMHVCTD